MALSTLPRLRTVATGLLGLAVAAGAAGAAPALADTSREGTTALVALDTAGAQAPAKSHINGSAPVSSHDGRRVVFSTTSPLVPEDDNGLTDVYLRDTVEGTTVLVSTTAAGAVGNGDSFEPTISSGGHVVAFTTTATNLVRDRNGDTLDVVVRDLAEDTLWLASVRSDGTQTQGNSFFPVLSGDGGTVTFQSFGRFVTKDDDRREDVYAHGESGRTGLVSVGTRNRNFSASVLNGDVSYDGLWVVFGNDNNVWLRDVAGARTRRVWHEDNDPAQPFPAGSVGRPVLSGDARFAAFTTMSTSVVKGEKGHYSDVFRVHLRTGRTKRVVVSARGGLGNDHSFIPSLSHGGRYVGFSSFAENLVPGDAPGSDVYVRDMATGTTYLASAGLGGPADGESGRTAVSISGDGRTLVYETYADNVAPGDVNRMPEVVAWRR